MVSQSGFVYHPVDELAVRFFYVHKLSSRDEAALHMTHAIFHLALGLSRQLHIVHAVGSNLSRSRIRSIACLAKSSSMWIFT